MGAVTSVAIILAIALRMELRQTITANEIILKDKHGLSRITLSSNVREVSGRSIDTHSISFFDQNGNVKSEISLINDEPTLKLYGQPRALGLSLAATGILIGTDTGRLLLQPEQISLNSSGRGQILLLSGESEGPTVVINDAARKRAWALPETLIKLASIR